MNRSEAKGAIKMRPSGFWDLLGMETGAVNAEGAEVLLKLEPKHLNSHGTLHGGVLTTLIDTSGGLAGLYCPHTHSLRKAVTLSLTTSFIAATSSGIVRAVGRKRSAGRTIFIATVEVFDEAGKLIATGEGTYRYLNEPRP